MVVCKSFVIALFYCYEYHCVTRPICITSMERDTHRVNSDDNSSGPHRRNMEFSWSHHISSSSLTYRRVLSLECEATKTQLNYPTDFCSTPSIYVIEWQRKGGCQRPTQERRWQKPNAQTPIHHSKVIPILLSTKESDFSSWLLNRRVYTFSNAMLTGITIHTEDESRRPHWMCKDIRWRLVPIVCRRDVFF